MENKKILIRTDGYNQIGFGHIYRCLILAKRLQNNKILFLSNSNHKSGIRLIKESKFRVEMFNSEKQMLNIIESFKPHIIINDILDTKVRYMKHIAKLGEFIINFEDLGNGSKYADLVINALYEKKNDNQNQYWGEKYYLLKEEFQKIATKTIQKGVKKILITFGGTDPNNYSRRIIEILDELKLNDLLINIILGLGYKNTEKLKEKIKDYDLNIKIKQNVNNISRYIFNADLIFTSAGRTVYEIASIGTPTIVLAQNKREMLHTFAKRRNGFLNLGLGYTISNEKIKSTIKLLMKDFRLRKKMNKKMLKHNLKSGLNTVINLISDKFEKKNEIF